MEYRQFQPSEDVRDFVEHYWTLEVDARAPHIQRVVPDGCPELIVNLAQPFEAFHDGGWLLQPACFLAGQITGPLLLRPSGHAKMIGIRFRPEGAFRFFRQPMHEATDRFVTVDDLSPNLARAF